MMNSSKLSFEVFTVADYEENYLNYLLGYNT
jgi:hypothetical protein